MKEAYPAIMIKDEDFVVSYIPDFEINSQGVNYVDAIEKARDAIGIVGLSIEDSGQSLPRPSQLAEIRPAEKGSIVTLIDVDFSEYRRQHEQRTVRRNVSLPSWLNAKAEKENINVSAVLQAALKEVLSSNE